MNRAATLAALVVALGGMACASALPPRDTPSPIDVDPGGIDEMAAGASAAEGDRLWQLRPDAAAVAAARDAYVKAAALAPGDVLAVIGAARALVWLADHEADQELRRQLASDAVRVALDCEPRAPASAACPYWLALAIGVQADARRATALDGVKRMVPLLRQAIEADEAQDSGGPHRVLARVLAQAPGWPTGPGDPDEAVEEARTAVELFPEHAPNWLALGEAWAKAGNPFESRRAYERAGELALTAQQAGHPDAAEWMREAAEARPRR